jgi:hypothetical protein
MMVMVTATTLAPNARAQVPDTTVVYPWRLSYFPYLTLSPNDGLMGRGRVVLFRQSRWDDRVPLHDEVALEGGYSTRDAWLIHAQGDFPRLANRWRLQAMAEAGREARFQDVADLGSDTRQAAALEVTRRLAGVVSLALRGEAVHSTVPVGNGLDALPTQLSETDARGRIALIVDTRDREYDTRRGLLLQGGGMIGSAQDGYHGWYAMASGWIPLGEHTRVTARGVERWLSRSSIDADRTVPGWEDEFLAMGGPHSSRVLPVAALTGPEVQLVSAEARHDLFVFPGGAVAVLAFVDAGRARYAGADLPENAPPVETAGSRDWVVGPGAGVALRLLRNAVLTATVGRALHQTRVYVSSGWAW